MTVHSRQGVLIVEDQRLILMSAVDTLTDHGYDVAEAGGADEALEILNERAEDFGLLFTDILMPGSMDGLELARQVRGRWPWIGVLIASGLPMPLVRALPAGSRLMAKVYDPATMAMHARELLATG